MRCVLQAENDSWQRIDTDNWRRYRSPNQPQWRWYEEIHNLPPGKPFCVIRILAAAKISLICVCEVYYTQLSWNSMSTIPSSKLVLVFGNRTKYHGFPTKRVLYVYVSPQTRGSYSDLYQGILYLPVGWHCDTNSRMMLQRLLMRANLKPSSICHLYSTVICYCF